MNFNTEFSIPKFLGMVLVVLLFVSCEEDLTDIGSGVVGSEPFETGKEVFNVFAFNKNIEAVRTNGLPIYQLGSFNDPVFGRTQASITAQVNFMVTANSSEANPTFGILTQDVEENPDPENQNQIQENETVQEVFLYIPYLNNSIDTDRDGVVDSEDADPNDPNSDSDNDGVTDIQESINNTDPLEVDTDNDGINDDVDEETFGDRFAIERDLDSIYIRGRRYDEVKDDAAFSKIFNLKVERSTFFLRDLDPNTNFQESQEYFSSQEFSPTFTDEVLFDGEVTISNKEILFVVEDDDPDTEDVNEEGTISSTLPPGIRVPLNNDFFQQNILDKEGSSELLSNANLREFFRGLHLSIDTDVLLLLNISQAEIDIVYNHDSFSNGGTTDDTSDDGIVKLEKTFKLQLLQAGGNAVNTFVNEDYPTNIQEELDNETNASRIYVKGGAGVTTQINLFEAEEGAENIIEELRAKNRVINEANLVFYIDREQLDNAGAITEPPRLYLYNADTNTELINRFTEQNNESQGLFGTFLNYDGIIEKDTDGKGIKYSIKITDHINNILVRDADNVPLGLTLTTDILNNSFANAMLVEAEKDLPVTSTLTPLGTVLYGPNIPLDNPDFDKRLKLEIFFTEID
ncbi:DUF4270 family protein [Maribacter sp. 2210JD10-5]|uniref:DUF4270 domain-containing protein n=1 Tax=Maribacter sp. 2210JD10-5 TaxID=3386272 RepID=UPI0039BC37C6